MKKYNNCKLKYSKSSSFYFDTKNSFFDQNNAFILKTKKQNLLYVSQPLRFKCKLCASALSKDADFNSHNVGYTFCDNCSHLNGMHEDTSCFVEELYIADNGTKYSDNYIDENYNKRTLDIYTPKVEFLIDNMIEKKPKILDIGCGSGYFVFASLLKNLEATGLDVNKSMVAFGNQQIYQHKKIQPLLFKDEKSFYETIIKSDADVISAIGVMEHLRDLEGFFDAFKKSNVKYLYYSVPMFSFSVILENVFDGVFPRQLSGGHTHLFTEKSLSKMHEILGVNSIAEWRFGTDIMDLYRSVLVNLEKNNVSDKMKSYLNSDFFVVIDKLQSELDKKHFCSEIHCLVSKF